MRCCPSAFHTVVRHQLWLRDIRRLSLCSQCLAVALIRVGKRNIDLRQNGDKGESGKARPQVPSAKRKSSTLSAHMHDNNRWGRKISSQLPQTSFRQPKDTRTMHADNACGLC
jgi:hypothetical protein